MGGREREGEQQAGEPVRAQVRLTTETPYHPLLFLLSLCAVLHCHSSGTRGLWIQAMMNLEAPHSVDIPIPCVIWEMYLRNSLSAWFRYKIYVEGFAWSVSLKYILACGSTPIFVRPSYYDFFSRALHPNVHFVQVPTPIETNQKGGPGSFCKILNVSLAFKTKIEQFPNALVSAQYLYSLLFYRVHSNPASTN